MNHILIGMPGSGKSTVGPALALKAGKDFMDTDGILKEKMGCSLKDFVAEHGYEAFLNMQEKAILSMKYANMVIATGGSVVCNKATMEHLKKDSITVFLKVDYEIIESRMAPDRKLAKASGKSLRQLYEERMPLYEKYADRIVDCNNRSVESIVEDILK